MCIFSAMKTNMSVQNHTIEPEDIEAVSAMLENEKQSHCRRRGLCFGLFVASSVVWILTIAVLVVALAVLLMNGRLDDVLDPKSLVFVQVLAVLSTAVMGSFTLWWAAQKCINSIERTLHFARQGRHRLFASFVNQLECTDKNKRALLLDIVGVVIN